MLALLFLSLQRGEGKNFKDADLANILHNA